MMNDGMEWGFLGGLFCFCVCRNRACRVQSFQKPCIFFLGCSITKRDAGLLFCIKVILTICNVFVLFIVLYVMRL